METILAEARRRAKFFREQDKLNPGAVLTMAGVASLYELITQLAEEFEARVAQAVPRIEPD